MEEFLPKDSGLFISCYREPENRNPLLEEPSVEPKPGRQPSSATREADPAKVKILKTLEVALVEEAAVADKAEILERMEELGIDELNRKFDQFIDDFKKKWKMEELQLVVV
ncbi:hypothetical protein HPP92_024931 [Vanilla planifolia]|uniref:Uncharacterized protein n=1 Tax=Vanilla planifolia TaxID=51239 RepID=A0A835PQ08_VANPL|nr:hypothetical protein HPP92_024931 [Vanilla planifolia]